MECLVQTPKKAEDSDVLPSQRKKYQSEKTDAQQRQLRRYRILIKMK
jgi:hypothetical protein